MEKQRMLKNIVIGVLLVAVISLSVSFAAFTQMLTINGTTTVKSAASNWNIKFSSVNAINTTGYAVGTPTSNSTTSQEAITFTCDLMAPGDTCSLSGTIKNAGSIKAKYTGVTLKVSDTVAANNSFEDSDVSINLIAPATWVANTTVLSTNDTGDFTLNVSAKDSATFTSAKTYTITATFNFDQAENE